LFTSNATLNKSTTAYSTSNEISNTSGSAYSAGGATLTSVTPTLSTDTAVCDFADVSFTSASFTANGALIYNSSQSDKAVAAIAFGSDKTVTSGTFTIQFPTADASNAIIRIA
jgi:poly-gamma-glutamate capsule biosynthesis protein CapA/YwtB (metallophosphatase superfamily)